MTDFIVKQYKIGEIILNEPDYLWVCNLAYESGMGLEYIMAGLMRPIERAVKHGKYVSINGKWEREPVDLDEYIKDGSFIKILYDPHYFKQEKLEVKNLPQLESFVMSEWLADELSGYWSSINPNGDEVSLIQLICSLVDSPKDSFSDDWDYYSQLTSNDSIFEDDEGTQISDEYKQWCNDVIEFKNDSDVFNFALEKLSEMSMYNEPSFNQIINPFDKLIIKNLPKLKYVDLDCDNYDYEINDWFEIDCKKVGVGEGVEVFPKRLLEHSVDLKSDIFG